MRMFEIASHDNTRIIVMKLWRKIMVVLRSVLIPHYWHQKSLTRESIGNGMG